MKSDQIRRQKELDEALAASNPVEEPVKKEKKKEDPIADNLKGMSKKDWKAYETRMKEHQE